MNGFSNLVSTIIKMGNACCKFVFISGYLASQNGNDVYTNFIPLSHLQGSLKIVIEDLFREHLDVALKDPLMFGDYRTALEESEPRLYEDIQDYDAAKALFQEVLGRMI